METSLLHGKENEKDHIWRRRLIDFEWAEALVGIVLLQRKISGITNETSKVRPNFSYCGNSSASKFGCCVAISRNGARLKVAVHNK